MNLSTLTAVYVYRYVNQCHEKGNKRCYFHDTFLVSFNPFASRVIETTVISYLKMLLFCSGIIAINISFQNLGCKSFKEANNKLKFSKNLGTLLFN